MTQEGQLPPPSVMWAQRRDVLFVTICLEDCKDPVLNIEPQMIYFKGVGGTEQKMHEVTINLYGEVIPNTTIQNLRGRTVELVLVKKEEGPYWPRLTKENTKAHWLKSDFNKWKDEDDSDEEGGMEGSGNDLQDMMRQMGGLGGLANTKPNFDDLDDLVGEGEGEGMDSEGEGMDSDDADLPDLL